MKKTISLVVATFFALSLAVAQEADTTPTTVTQPAATAERVPQEERIVIETRDRNTLAMRGLRVENMPTPRVPDGFGPLVTPAQREEIHRIHAEYQELISLLQMRIDLLTLERNIKFEEVLTPAQLERLSPVHRERLRPARLAPIRNLLNR